MRNPFSSRIQAFCAFCKSRRHIYRKKRIGTIDIIGSALGALVTMGFIFQDWDPRAFLIFVGFLALAETFIQLRWRMNIVCPHCSFDPVLYTKNPEAAAAKVKQRLEARQADPSMILATPLDLPKRKVKNSDETETKGKRLSKQV